MTGSVIRYLFQCDDKFFESCTQRSTLNPMKHLSWSFLRKKLFWGGSHFKFHDPKQTKIGIIFFTLLISRQNVRMGHGSPNEKLGPKSSEMYRKSCLNIECKTLSGDPGSQILFPQKRIWKCIAV